MDKGLLKSVIYTLNNIEVRGKTNMDRLLGCIRVLEMMANKNEETKDENEPEGTEVENG